MKSVRFFSSADAGAPQVSQAAGSLNAVLAACLVTGYGSINVTSITVAGEVATAQVNGGHGFVGIGSIGPVVRVSGATTPAALNDDWRITITSPTQFTFPVPGIGDQTATGTISVKKAPAGWTQPFSDTNVIALRNDSVEGTGAYFRVSDPSGADARIVGYTSMSNINTGANLFPDASQVAGGAYIGKSNGTTRPWAIFADHKRVLVAVGIHASYRGYHTAWFGDPVPRNATDALRALICSSTGSAIANVSNPNPFYNSTSYLAYSPKSYLGIGAPSPSTIAMLNPEGIAFLSGYGGDPYPNGPDNALILMDPVLVRSVDRHIRSRLPGLIYSTQNLGNHYAYAYIINPVENVLGYEGKVLAALPLYYYGNSTTVGTGFIDLTGPWE